MYSGANELLKHCLEAEIQAVQIVNNMLRSAVSNSWNSSV